MSDENKRIGPTGFWTFDVKKNLVYGDSVMALYFALSESAAAKGASLQQYLDAVHPLDRDRVGAEINDTMLGKANFLSEYRVIGSDGVCRRILATGQCFYEDGEPKQYPGFAFEIEDSKPKIDVKNQDRIEFVDDDRRAEKTPAELKALKIILDTLLEPWPKNEADGGYFASRCEASSNTAAVRAHLKVMLAENLKGK